tara:strand:+ start:112 stop:291 length:180 start_codon:yes stop_codon:yes gene_type:complete
MIDEQEIKELKNEIQQSFLLKVLERKLLVKPYDKMKPVERLKVNTLVYNLNRLDIRYEC